MSRGFPFPVVAYKTLAYNNPHKRTSQTCHFNVNWDTLETDALRDWTTELLTGALNSGTRPNILASDITIKDLNFGKIAPEFEILEIGELDKDRFRGIFKINYDGDFHLTLHTQVQANPLKIHSDNSREREVAEDAFVTPDFLLSTEPFNIPLDLKLSDIKISGIGIIVFSQTKGLTLVFRNDPLDSIKDHLKDQPPTSPLDVLELESVAPSNLKKLAKLYTSRETLDLKVPKIKNAAQRNRLEKFNKDYYPSLTNSLYSNLGIPPIEGVPQQNNGLPVELLVNNDFRQVDSILKEISTIQTKSLRSGSGEAKRAKRRTFKLGKKVSVATNQTENVSTSAEKPSTALDMEKTINLTKLPGGQKEAAHVEHDSNDGLSDTSTVHEEQCVPMEHPTPVKLRPLTRPLLHPSFEQKGDAFIGRHSPWLPFTS
ncbi:hypothetical protein HF325_004092 [Metschnikowia pulcherrima]|uniref:SMP-LTD domain-containing protein n=1 Tax=Metschnikowia pulcherrima TaxID=27326 RepID=A0A8H7GRY0_9ASCO|nr:hypothetical protein HF325_004092 [Metschnikowia pulcherrima]